MMLRWISDVPPAMVPENDCIQWTSQASASPRPTDGASWRVEIGAHGAQGLADVEGEVPAQLAAQQFEHRVLG